MSHRYWALFMAVSLASFWSLEAFARESKPKDESKAKTETVDKSGRVSEKEVAGLLREIDSLQQQLQQMRARVAKLHPASDDDAPNGEKARKASGDVGKAKAEEDEDDDEKPAAKKSQSGKNEKAVARKNAKSEEDEDDDDKPAAKKSQSGKSEKAVTRKNAKAEEDEDDDAKPAAKKSQSSKSEKAFSGKNSKAEEDEDDDEKPAAKREAVKVVKSSGKAKESVKADKKSKKHDDDDN